MRQILDQYDGITEYFDFDELTSEVTVKRVRDVQPLLDANRAKFNEGLVNGKSEFRHIGSFDEMAVKAWAKMRGIDDYMSIFKRGNERLLTELVNDPDMAAFRTLPGRYTFQSR